MVRIGRPIKDVTGVRFGSLVAVKPLYSDNGNMVWEFLCDCGEIVQRLIGNVQRSKNQACKKCVAKSVGDRCRTHGMSRTSLYYTWKCMIRRCTDNRDRYWYCYGGRGITVCDKWMSFEGFYDDMHESFIEGLELDRIDNNSNYCKDNCRWVTHKENCRNQRRSLVVDSEELGWKSGIHPRTIRDRIQRGWPIDKLTVPTDPRNKVLNLHGLNTNKYKYEER